MLPHLSRVRCCPRFDVALTGTWRGPSEPRRFKDYSLVGCLQERQIERPVRHKGYGSDAAVDLDNLQIFPLHPLLATAVNHQPGRVRRGEKESCREWFIQGSRLPRIVPSLTVPPRAHDPFQPHKLQPFYMVLVASTGHFGTL